MKKLLFLIGADGDTFVRPVMEHLSGQYDICTITQENDAKLHKALLWCDLAWFEWATHYPVLLDKFNDISCKTIVRLHRYEAYTGWMNRINWDLIDDLIIIGNPFVELQLLQTIPNFFYRTRLHVIPNGVQIQNNKFKSREKGHNIAYISNMRMVKNPMLMFQCMRELVNWDKSYHLSWAGKWDDPLLKQYAEQQVKFLDLTHNIHFDGWQNDLNSWLEDKQYILNTSVIESQCMSIMEAMAIGIKPLIYAFPGAETIYKPEYLFRDTAEFCRKVLEERYCSEEYYEFIKEKYSFSILIKKIENLIKSCLGLFFDLDSK